MPRPPHHILGYNKKSLSKVLLTGGMLALNLPAIDTVMAADKAIPAQQSLSPSEEKKAENTTKYLEEMVVSATKTETTLSNSPAAVTVVNQKDLDARNVSRLGDALSKVPSLYLGFPALGQNQGSSGAGGFSLRGVDTRRTLVLVDGQPIQDANSNNVEWRTVMTEDIERVEVVPGAFSSLYGSSAVGGVINVMTKQPTKHELTIRGKKSFQDAEGEDASIYWREHFNNGLGVVAGFGYQNRDGYMNEYNVRPVVAGAAGTRVTGAIPTTTRQGDPAYIVGEKGPSPWTQMNATAKLDFKPTDRDHLFAGWAFSGFDMGYTARLIVICVMQRAILFLRVR
jgi:iron complex outermembrane receptor protein